VTIGVSALFLVALLAQLPAPIAGPRQSEQVVERWGIFELSLNGPQAGNPFIDVRFSAEFRYRNRAVTVDGFYDGEGVYRVRLMPDTPGVWTYVTRSNRSELDGRTGQFTCTTASEGNHGPVRIRSVSHFGYEDGAPYFPFGTTAYTWAHQDDALAERTLNLLRASPFNKLRMLILPKDSSYNRGTPERRPFDDPDFTRFNVEFFRLIERRVGALLAMGVEADLILFHPYDRVGYKRMPPDTDDRYLRYIVARFAAYRNVWWSLANEYDLLDSKRPDDWDRLFRILVESDPSGHLRSIHHLNVLYDHSKPWVTHVSLQSADFGKARQWIADYRKPVVYDECEYEGDIPQHWGNLSGREMVRRFWLGTAAGAYVGHGESFYDANDMLWITKGGVLRGESVPRIAFLRKIVEQGPTDGLAAMSSPYPAIGKEGHYHLIYFDAHQPIEHALRLPDGARYRADIIDTWEMSITPVERELAGSTTIRLPGKPYMAVRIRKLD
jgi:hypothetical protein